MDSKRKIQGPPNRLPWSIYSIKSIVTQTKPWCRIVIWEIKYTTNNSMRSVNIKITCGSPGHPGINYRIICQKELLLCRPCRSNANLIELLFKIRSTTSCPTKVFLHICLEFCCCCLASSFIHSSKNPIVTSL